MSTSTLKLLRLRPAHVLSSTVATQKSGRVVVVRITCVFVSMLCAPKKSLASLFLELTSGMFSVSFWISDGSVSFSFARLDCSRSTSSLQCTSNVIDSRMKKIAVFICGIKKKMNISGLGLGLLWWYFWPSTSYVWVEHGVSLTHILDNDIFYFMW